MTHRHFPWKRTTHCLPVESGSNGHWPHSSYSSGPALTVSSLPSARQGQCSCKLKGGGRRGAGLLQEGGRTLMSAGRCWVTMPHRQQMTTGLIWSDCLMGKGWRGRGIIWPQFRVSMFCLFEYLDNVGYLDGPISFIYSCYSFIIIMLLFASRRVRSYFTDTSPKLSKCVHMRSPRLPRYPNCCLFLSLLRKR